VNIVHEYAEAHPWLYPVVAIAMWGVVLVMAWIYGRRS
jgi:hypothetical protein